jgi:pyrroloquinoline quinone biosynthesis protein B
LRVLVLGSAAGGGFPQWNCHCANCRRARAGDPAARARTQSSLAVTADGERWFLLNASPDLRQQVAAHPPLEPRSGPRHSPLAGAVLTNGDVDHVAGLLSLRESQPLAVYGTERVLALLAANSIFRVLNPDLVARRPLPLEKPVELAGMDGAPSGLEVLAYEVPGKVALYAEDQGAGPGLGTRPGDTIGLEVADRTTGARFHYLPGCASMPAGLAARLKGASLVFFDGTLWRDDEMITTGLGSKTGGRMGHMSVMGGAGTIAAFETLGVARKVFIHINNSNPMILDDSPERAAAEAAGWQVAWDGMEIAL